MPIAAFSRGVVAPGRLNDVLELGLQGGTADQESIDIGLANELAAVAAVNGATVEDAGSACNVI